MVDEIFVLVCAILCKCTAIGEIQEKFSIAENVTVGSLVGNLRIASSNLRQDRGGQPAFLVVHPPEYDTQGVFAIDEFTGNIRTKKALDYETRNSYTFLAIPTDGSSVAVRVTLKIMDVNDNAPNFPVKSINLQLSEWTKIHSEIPLPAAFDADQGSFGVHHYQIISGDLNSTFSLSYAMPGSKISYLNLILNSNLDRESLDKYSLLIRCWDGGQQPFTADLLVNVTVLDANDNAPVFDKHSYNVKIGREQQELGRKLIRIHATDKDIGENGEILYSFAREPKEYKGLLELDRQSGWVTMKGIKRSEREGNDILEYDITARDKGLPSLDSVAKLYVNYTEAHERSEVDDLHVVFQVPLSSHESTSGTVSEDAPLGTVVAKLFLPDRNPEKSSDRLASSNFQTATLAHYLIKNFSISSEGDGGPFRIVTDSSNQVAFLVLDGPLDREKQANYTINATFVPDGPRPEWNKKRVSRQLRIFVTDINDNAPRFSSEVYSTTLRKNATPGTLISKVTAIDVDEGMNAEIRYFFNRSSIRPTLSEDQMFEIERFTGFISVANGKRGQLLECELTSNFELIVSATDQGQNPLISHARVLIDVLGFNDYEPKFDKSTYKATVREDTENGTCFLQVLAIDTDCGLNGKVNYALLADSREIAQTFLIDRDTGSICLNGSLDYELKQRYHLTISAEDKGGLKSFSSLRVIVEDVNDNAPLFFPTLYNVSLRQNVPVGQTIAWIRATDRDSGPLGAVRYTMVSPVDDNHFGININTGELFVNAQLSPTIYEFHIIASDGGLIRSSNLAEVRVTVITSDYSSPVFDRASYAIIMREDTLPGIILAQCKAYGLHPLVYTIQDGDPDQLFGIDPDSGKISLRKRLDYGSFYDSHNYLLNVQVASGYPVVYNNTQLRIDVEDGNNHDPKFDSKTFYVSLSENFPLLTTFFVLSADDLDSGHNSEIRYRLLDNYNGQFLLHVVSGELKLAKNLDFEQYKQYKLLITAQDSGIPPKNANVTVMLNVLDENDNSPTLGLSGKFEFSIQENKPIGTELGRVLAYDLDSNANGRLFYDVLVEKVISLGQTLTSVKNTFGIYSESGTLYSKNMVDREKFDLYELSIRVSDNGRPSRSANGTVKIAILDDNDNPPVCQDSGNLYYNVEENQPTKLTLDKLNCIDKDLYENARLSYSLINNFAGLFSIDNDGMLYVEKALDREEIDEFDLSIRVSDNGQQPLSTVCQRTVRVKDVNDNSPYFVLPQNDYFYFREQQQVGAEVFQVKAHDRDHGSNATIMYRIESELRSVPFEIHVSSGLISCNRALDYENDQRIFRFYVVAEDQGTPVRKLDRKLFTIELTDVPNGGPAKNESISFAISENTPIGTIIAKLGTNGTKYGNEIVANTDCDYSLVSGNSYGIYDIEKTTGTIYLIKKLDFESQTSHYLTVERRNLSTNPKVLSKTLVSMIFVHVSVIDENDNAPVFNDDTIIFSVAEDTGLNKILYTINATDADSGSFGRLSYFIVESGSTISRNRTHQAAVQLDGRAIGASNLKDSLSYSFDSCNASHYFKVDDVSGDISLVVRLDFERCSEFTFVVAAEDQAANVEQRLQTRVIVRIYVVDVNDNAPRFIISSEDNGGSRRTIYMMEDEPVGYSVAYLTAVDADWLENGRVSYKLLNVNTNNAEMFELNRTTGLLQLARPLTRKDPRIFNLEVEARDHGFPLLSTAQHVVINVISVKNNDPSFDQSLYVIDIMENTVPGRNLMQVKARPSQDHGQPGGLKYHLASVHKNSGFKIDESSGVLTTNFSLDREKCSTYYLTVYVKDDDHPSQYDIATVKINVSDQNDNAPKFAPSSCHPFFIPENKPIRNLTRLIAFDLDIEKNGQVSYSIVDGNADLKFYLDPLTGVLSCNSLDFESYSAYNLTIRATDRASSQSKADFCSLIVNVLDENDNTPIFEYVRYLFNLEESAEVGSKIGQPVRAMDKDQGANGLVSYSILNDTAFDVDRWSGQIRLKKKIDFEKKQNYTFEIEATDQGPVVSKRSTVQIIIDVIDVNDNAPVFETPVTTVKINNYLSIGQRVAKVVAKDADGPGRNSDISYSFLNEYDADNYSMNPSTGVISAKINLHFLTGSVFYLHVIASDKGHPKNLQSKAIVRLLIVNSESEDFEDSAVFQFERQAYEVKIVKHAPAHALVTQLIADGPTRGLEYSIFAGNDDGSFEIELRTGKILIANGSHLDRKIGASRYLIVEAKANYRPDNKSSSNLAYASVKIDLADSNDQTPQFKQIRYSSSIREGSPRETVVSQVLATYEDHDMNAQLTYSIIGGNLDRAFSIDRNGFLTTNVELDREIHDRYTLIVSASDRGTPIKTVNSTVDIRVLDVNDNSPKFPPTRIIEISENADVGSYITTLSANDVDLHPALSYSLTSSENSASTFTISKFSGELLLLRKLDYEEHKEYNVEIKVSDSLHEARIVQKIIILDENDNEPVFEQESYRFALLIDSKPDTLIGNVSAVDGDSDENGRISYRLIEPLGKSLKIKIDAETGALSVDSNIPYHMVNEAFIEYTVEAADHGIEPRVSYATIFVQVVEESHETKVHFSNSVFNFFVNEDEPVHSVIGRLSTVPQSKYSVLTIDPPDSSQTFFVDAEGNLILLKSLDREHVSNHRFSVSMNHKLTGSVNASCLVNVNVLDVNDNVPVFLKPAYNVLITDLNTDNNQTLENLTAIDADIGDNGRVSYEISSGTHADLFRIDSDRGILFLAKPVDSRSFEYENSSLIVKASDSGRPVKSSFVTVNIRFSNKNRPQWVFPLTLYLGRIFENEVAGNSLIFTAKALSLRGRESKDGYYFLSGKDSANFKINSTSGDIYSSIVFDFEQKTSYKFKIHRCQSICNDSITNGSLIASTYGQVLIKGRDEFAPKFTQKSYEFKVPYNSEVGQMIGVVYANDDDKGADGLVKFALMQPNDFFAINPETGVLMVIRSLNTLNQLLRKNGSGLTVDQMKSILTNKIDPVSSSVRLETLAYSGPDVDSGRSSSVGITLFLGDFDLNASAMQNGIDANTIILIISIVLLLLALASFLLILVRKYRRDAAEKLSTERKISYHNYSSKHKNRDKCGFVAFSSPVAQKKSHLIVVDNHDCSKISSAIAAESASSVDTDQFTASFDIKLQPNIKMNRIKGCDKPVKAVKTAKESRRGDRLESSNSNSSAISSGRGSDNTVYDSETDCHRGNVARLDSGAVSTGSLSRQYNENGELQRDKRSGSVRRAVDSGIHLFPSDFGYNFDEDDVESTVNVSNEESGTSNLINSSISTREYLASLGVKLTKDDTSKSSITSLSKNRQGLSNGIKKRESSTKLLSACDNSLASLEHYLALDTDPVPLDGPDLNELIYSKIGEVMADEAASIASKDGAGAVWTMAHDLPDVARPVATHFAARNMTPKHNSFRLKNGSRHRATPAKSSPLTPTFQPVTQIISEAADRVRKNSLPKHNCQEYQVSDLQANGSRSKEAGFRKVNVTSRLENQVLSEQNLANSVAVRHRDSIAMNSEFPLCVCPTGIDRESSAALTDEGHPTIETQERSTEKAIDYHFIECVNDGQNIEIEIKI